MNKPQKIKIKFQMPYKVNKISKGEIVAYVIFILIALYLASAIGAALDLSTNFFGKMDLSALGANFSNALGNPKLVFEKLNIGGSNASKMLSAAVFVVGLMLLIKFITPKKRLHRKGVEHGSARFGTEKEALELRAREATKIELKPPLGNRIAASLGFTELKKETKTVYGKPLEPKFQPLLTTDGKRVFDKETGNIVGVIIDENILLTEEVFLALNGRQHMMNLHVMVIGGSGAGKTRFFAKPNILQLNTSYVITDPKVVVVVVELQAAVRLPTLEPL